MHSQHYYCSSKTRVSRTDGCFDKSSADCCLTSLFSLFRVCVKKSSQERLALKILIDRPKARNEVRGNTATVVAEQWLLLAAAASYHRRLAIHPRSFFRCFLLLFVLICAELFSSTVPHSFSVSLAAIFCYGRAARTPGRGAVKTDGHTL